MVAADWAEIQHFTPAEFTHPDRMGYEMILWLDAVRHAAGVSMPISSSYRTTSHNASVGGAADSAHCDDPCNAVDIRKAPTPSDPNWNFARAKIIGTALSMGCVRVGLYANGSIHLDRSEHCRPFPRIWNAVDNPAKVV